MPTSRASALSVLLGSLLWSLATAPAAAAGCKVDPAYASMAAATGGSVICGGSSASLTSALDVHISASSIELTAGWKVLGHGGFDEWHYRDYADLPRDRLRGTIWEIPADVKVEEVTAMDPDGARSLAKASIRVSPSSLGPGQQKIEFRLDTPPSAFHLAVRGTRNGVRFVAFSPRMQAGQHTDKELGLQVWKEILSTLRKSSKVDPATENKLLDSAFK